MNAGVARPTVAVAGGLVAVVGFEHDAVWWEWGAVSVRWGQALGLAVVVIAIVDAVRRRRRESDVLIPLLFAGFGIWSAVSWWAVDRFPQNMAATTFRVALVAAVGIAVWWLAREAVERATLARLVVGVGAVAALVGILAVASGGEWWFTDVLRGSPTELGPHQRLTRPFNHANVAAMVFGPLAVVACGLAIRRRVWWLGVAPIVVACVLTYSRMAPVALACGAAVAAYASTRRSGFATLGGVLVLTVVATAALSPVWSSRLGSPGNQAWYGVQLQIDGEVAGAPTDVRIANRSDVDWEAMGPDAVEVSLRWRSVSGEIQYLDERFPLPESLESGEVLVATVSSTATATLAPGTYELIVDVVRDQVAFFGEVTESALVIEVDLPSATGTAAGQPVRRPIPEMARRDLWEAAGRLAIDNPVVGVGTGNYRLVYGAELGLEQFPRSSHAHSLYLEPAASSGLPAAAALVALVLVVWIRTGRHRSALEPLDAALVGGAVTMAVHGLVDWPLIFTGSGTLFFVMFALAGRAVERDRVDG